MPPRHSNGTRPKHIFIGNSSLGLFASRCLLALQAKFRHGRHREERNRTRAFCFRSEVRDAVRKELGIGESAFVLGHVGRFQHQKNHAYLLDVYAKARPMLNDSVLLLAGDGPLRDELQRQTERLKLENSVRFLGVRSDIDRLLQALDLFVFPRAMRACR